MNRKSISASFNSKEFEAIDRVCAKLGITRGRLIKQAKKKKSGRPPNPKRKRGDRKQRGEGEI